MPIFYNFIAVLVLAAGLHVCYSILDHGKSTFIHFLRPGSRFLLLSTVMSKHEEVKLALCKKKVSHTVLCYEKHKVPHNGVIRFTVISRL